eukprot:5049448-Pleurochrysis_carterae.AAC.1
MHIGESTFPVLLGHNKLPELVGELRTLDMDKRAVRRGLGSTCTVSQFSASSVGSVGVPGIR